MKIILKDGARVEGVLEGFAGGTYTLAAEGKSHAVVEDDIRSIRFVSRPFVPPGGGASPEVIGQLVDQLRCRRVIPLEFRRWSILPLFRSLRQRGRE